jgi:tripartite-type tricarboxylate transporter receptor subunit TctC
MPAANRETTMKTVNCTWIISSALLAIGAASSAQADEFYRGKSIDVIVASAPGGGYDLYARLLARYMGRYLPGNPTFVVQDMPGAGGVRATQFLFNVARRDGTVIGIIAREAPLIPLLEPDKGAQFNAAEFNWIGSPQQELGLLIVNSRSPAQTLQELKEKAIAVSATGPGTAPSVFPRVLNNVFGTKFKVVDGYAGSQEALLAVEKGEVDGHVSGGSSSGFRARIDPWIEKGQAKVLMQLGFRKDAAYAQAPLALDLVQNADDRQLLELVFSPQLIGRPFLAPPGLPQERVALLQASFDQTMHDTEFLAEAQKLQMEVNPVRGDDIKKLLQRVYAMPAGLIERAKKVVK